MNFHTTFQYDDRASKAQFVWLKYGSILQGSILDVGADECHLRAYLPPDAQYWGIGMGGTPDQRVNLEVEGVPFPADSYDCVLCLDVLEHLNNPHAVFDELCRVSRQYVIIALPNAWTFFTRLMRSALLRGEVPVTKYYGLPPEPPEDRHKWFFSASEAQAFIEYRANKNNLRVVQIDDYRYSPEGQATLRHRMAQLLLTPTARRNLLTDTVWAVLQK